MKTAIATYSVERIRQTFGIQIVVICFYFVQHILDWPLLRISRMRGEFNFEDFVTIFTSAKCFQDIGLQIYEPEQGKYLCFYPYGRTFIYVIDLFRIPASWAPTLIVMASLLILNIMARLLGDATRVEKSVFILFFVSPPLWLGFERGNADLLICLMVLLSAYYSSMKRDTVAILILVLSVLIKFYTFPLLVYLLWRRKQHVNKLLVMLLLAFLVFVMFTDLQIQKLQQPGSFAFGAPVVTFWANAINSYLKLGYPELSIRIGHFLGLALLGLLTLYFLGRIYKDEDFSRQENDPKVLTLNFLGIVYVTCFAVGMSYDYRLIFPALAGIILFALKTNLGIRKRYVFFCWFLNLWLSVFSFGLDSKTHLLLQWVGNVFSFLTASLLAAVVIRLNFTQLRFTKKRRKSQDA